MEIIIITRHQGMVNYLAAQGITGQVIAHVSAPDQVRGAHVYGAIPLHLAALAASVTVVDMPTLPAEMRGQDLTAEQMTQYGATMSTYCVRRL